MMARNKGWRNRPKAARIVCSGICFVLGIGLLASPAAIAQEQWWERTFPGAGGRPEARPAAHEDRKDRQDLQQLNDLRPDRTPLRSQEMIDALEAAIERYQAIVTKGGWPIIPGTQPIRPEDNDERVAMLYRRLSISGE